tara:strand:- start:1334 stop:1627 length:294 start_codon:yes stop_codon:yes gene_type:complete
MKSEVDKLEHETQQTLDDAFEKAEQAIICGEYEKAGRVLKDATRLAFQADLIRDEWYSSNDLPMPAKTYSRIVESTSCDLAILTFHLLYTGFPRPEA